MKKKPNEELREKLNNLLWGKGHGAIWAKRVSDEILALFAHEKAALQARIMDCIPERDYLVDGAIKGIDSQLEYEYGYNSCSDQMKANLEQVLEEI